MKIELVLDQNGFVSGFRSGWKPWTKNKPNPKLVFTVPKSDFMPLVNFLHGRPVVLATETKHDAKFGHALFLTSLDYADDSALKDSAFINAFS